MNIENTENRTLEYVTCNSDEMEWELSETEVLYVQYKADDLDYIPSNMDTVFPNLLKLSYQHTSLDQISYDDMKQFPLLESFIFDYNMITVLPADLFSGNPELFELRIIGPIFYFRNNSLHTIGQDLLKSIPKLNVTSFLNNFCLIQSVVTTREKVLEANEKANLLCNGGEEISTVEPTEPPTTPPATEAPTTERLTTMSTRSTTYTSMSTTTSSSIPMHRDDFVKFITIFGMFF